MRSIQRANLVRTARAKDEEWDLYEKISEMPNSSDYQLAKLTSWTTGNARGAVKRLEEEGLVKIEKDHPSRTSSISDNANHLARDTHHGRAGRVQAVGDLKYHSL